MSNEEKTQSEPPQTALPVPTGLTGSWGALDRLGENIEDSQRTMKALPPGYSDIGMTTGVALPVPQVLRVDLNRATEITPLVEDAIVAMFTYSPWDDAQTENGIQVRLALAAAVSIIIERVPPSPDRSAAIRKLREARMDCNSAITHGGRF